MDSNRSFLMRRYSTFRNDLPFLVWQRYFTKASPAPVVIRSRSKCPMKSTCVSQHCVLKVHLLMISSFVTSCPPNALALASPGRVTAPTSAQAPVASRFLRGIVILVIVRSPFHDVV